MHITLQQKQGISYSSPKRLVRLNDTNEQQKGSRFMCACLLWIYKPLFRDAVQHFS